MGRSSALSARIVLVFLDTLTGLLGVGLLGLSIFLYSVKNFSGSNGTSLVLYAIMGLSGVIVLVSFLGAFGACCRSYCLLVLYATLLSLIVALQCSALIFILIFRSQVQDFVDGALRELLVERKAAPSSTATAFDFVQTVFRCCGVTGFIDYGSTLTLPSSCCRGGGQLSCVRAMVIDREPGCRMRVMDLIYGPNKVITMGVVAGIVFVELLLILLASCLSHRIREDRA